jgi:hypothetical protein
MRHLFAALALLISTSAAAAPSPDHGALDVHALLDSITDAQRAEFHIAQATWKSAADTPAIGVHHAYLLGSLEGVATYDADGSIVTAGLTILPTTYLIRIPASWNGRVIFLSPPGFRNHLTIFPVNRPLLQQGYATVMVDAPQPGSPTFPYDAFIGAYRTHDTGAAVFSTVHMVKDLFRDAFAGPLKSYYLGQSGGSLFGAGLIIGRRGNPIDGYLLVAGGNGWRTETDEHMRSYRPGNSIPLSGLPPVPPLTPAAFNLAVDTEIGLADPEYRELILAGGGYQALIDYDSTTRPAAVQRAWAHLEYNPDLQAPVIVLQGTADTIQYPRNCLVFTKRVIDAGRSDRLRLYMIKGQGHGPIPPFPLQGLLDSVEQLKRWVEDDKPPGVIRFESPLYGIQDVKNNWDAGYPNDPCGYFHHQFDPEVQPPADCGL